MHKKPRLQKAQSIWQYGINHPSYVTWYKNSVFNFNFFAGVGEHQWLPNDLQILKERGQIPLTFNLLPSFINALCGVEIQSRFSVGCRVDMEDKEMPDGELSYSKLSKALTHLLLTWQRNENVPRQGTWKLKDAMICGLAWSTVYLEDSGVIKYKYCNPLTVIPDFDDTSPQFTNMKFVLKEWYMPRDEILKKWPKAKSEVNFDDDLLLGQYAKSAELQKYAPTTGYQNNAWSVNPLVCEVQYKEAKKAYSGLTEDGRYFETFDLAKAEDLSGKGSEITEFNSWQIIRTRFIGDCLLESAPLTPDFPGQEDFSYVPFVWEKTKLDNLPYAFMEPLKSIQLDLNKRMTNSVYYMQSKQFILEGTTMQGIDLIKMKRELNNRNSVIQVPIGGKITVNTNIPLAEEQIKISREYLEFFQRVSGIQDEMLGIQTNATSGVAQEIRQVNSVRTNIFAFDNLAMMKSREALIAVNLFQNAFVNNYYISCQEGDETEAMYLNLTVKDFKGQERVVNNVSFLPVTLYFDELHNVVSSLDNIRQGALMIIQNPVLLQMPSLLKDLGLRHADKYIADFKQQQAEIQQQAQQQAMMQQEVQGQARGNLMRQSSQQSMMR
jgi:hypothetical protein